MKRENHSYELRGYRIDMETSTGRKFEQSAGTLQWTMQISYAFTVWFSLWQVTIFSYGSTTIRAGNSGCLHPLKMKEWDSCIARYMPSKL